MFVLCFCKAVTLLVLIGLEQEVNTAPYASNLVLARLIAVSILTSEELESGYDVLSPCVVSTELPTFQGIVTLRTCLEIVSSLESSNWGELTICYISTPRALLSCIGTLVVQLNAWSYVKI